MRPLPANLNWLRSFESAARLGSFTAAAAELGVTQAAVSHHIRTLEAVLGTRLFLRGARTLALTDPGRAYLPAVARALHDIALSTQAVFGPPTRRVVTIRAPISTSTLWLAPRLEHLRARFPGVGVRLVSEIWPDAVAQDDVDIDIRLGNGVWPGLRAELLSDETVVPVMAPDKAAVVGGAHDLAQVDRVSIMGFDEDWRRFFDRHGIALPDDPDFLSVDTTLAAVSIVSRGSAAAMIMKRLALDLIAAGQLALADTTEIDCSQSHYLLSTDNAWHADTLVADIRGWLSDLFREG